MNVPSLFRIVLYVSIGCFCASFFQKNVLPGKKHILKQLYINPSQTKTNAASFRTIVNEKTYVINPVYKYELYGLVVSCHDTAAWWDYYHKKWGDVLNLKDICVIWGDNIKSEVYKRMKFRSGSWTCYVSVNARTEKDDWKKFRMDCLSNNHLLSDNDDVNKVIRKIDRGDQIYVKGYLANYLRKGSTFKRATSTTRADAEGGACETVYVTECRILKKGNAVWRFLFAFSGYLMLLSFVILIVLNARTPAYH